MDIDELLDGPADDGSRVPPHKRVLLAVIDGLGAAPLRRALAAGHAPNLQRVLDAGGRFDDAISPFPSLTPVCLSTIATGVGPDRHRVPSLSWFHRGERRIVEYGSSFSATGAAEGTPQSIRDVVLNLNLVHLAEDPPTIFEVLADAGLESASINHLIYRGRTRHNMRHSYLKKLGETLGTYSVYGPPYLYWGELYGNKRPMLPQVGIKRPKDWGAGHIARWLLRNTECELVLLYLGEHDVASHRGGPDSTAKAISVADRAMGRAIEAMGGIEAFERGDRGLVLCADHGQTQVLPGHSERVADSFEDLEVYGGRRSDVDRCDIAITPSNRVAMIYRLGDASPKERWLAERAVERPGTDLVTFREDGWIVVRRGDAELRACHGDASPGGQRTNEGILATPDRADPDGVHRTWRLVGDPEALDVTIVGDAIGYGAYPDGLARIASALDCINAGDVLLSGEPGWEYQDLGGVSHSGGSHGSLHVSDSTAPLITIGLPEAHLPPLAALGRPHASDETGPDGQLRLSDVAPSVLRSLGL